VKKKVIIRFNQMRFSYLIQTDSEFPFFTLISNKKSVDQINIDSMQKCPSRRGRLLKNTVAAAAAWFSMTLQTSLNFSAHKCNNLRLDESNELVLIVPVQNSHKSEIPNFGYHRGGGNYF
jgi:hypothetical protein